MTVYTYYSTDTGAPSLDGLAGSLISVLDAVLVNGYNSQSSLSIARSSSTATVTKTSHGYREGQILTISGANEAEYNGSFRIGNVTANTFTYTVSGTPATPATGSISAIVAPAGWTKPYSSGSNLAVFRGPSGTTQHYFRFDDTGGVSATFRGYEAMTGVSTGTNDFPTVAQVASLYVMKSSAASSATRAWALITNGKTIHFISNYDTTTTGTSSMWISFGDFVSKKSGDVYNSFVAAGTTTSGNTTFYPNHYTAALYSTFLSGHYLSRAYTQIGTAATFSKVSDATARSTTDTVMGSNGFSFPNSPDGGLYFAPIRMYETGPLYRGDIPGAYVPLHVRPLSHNDEFAGQGVYSGKRFITKNLSGNGQVFLEISDTW